MLKFFHFNLHSTYTHDTFLVEILELPGKTSLNSSRVGTTESNMSCCNPNPNLHEQLNRLHMTWKASVTDFSTFVFKITKLKIDANPFASAYRRDGLHGQAKRYVLFRICKFTMLRGTPDV